MTLFVAQATWRVAAMCALVRGLDAMTADRLREYGQKRSVGA